MIVIITTVIYNILHILGSTLMITNDHSKSSLGGIRSEKSFLIRNLGIKQ